MSGAAAYVGTVRHRRLEPTVRQFEQRIFLAYVDVEQLPGSFDRLPGWSARRPAPVRFRREDFLDGGSAPLGDAVRHLVHERLGRWPGGAVHLLANLRTLGWLSNPLSVYYCFGADDRELDAIVLEVTSTPWGERHWYVVDALGEASSPPMPKAMHVSPFLPMELDYRVEWTPPESELWLAITVSSDDNVVFAADLRLQRRALDRRSAATLVLRHPLLPLRVSLGIYRRALLLFLAGVPAHRRRAPSTPKVHA